MTLGFSEVGEKRQNNYEPVYASETKRMAMLMLNGDRMISQNPTINWERGSALRAKSDQNLFDWYPEKVL